jgi:hypothetical protein
MLSKTLLATAIRAACAGPALAECETPYGGSGGTAFSDTSNAGSDLAAYASQSSVLGVQWGGNPLHGVPGGGRSSLRLERGEIVLTVKITRGPLGGVSGLPVVVRQVELITNKGSRLIAGTTNGATFTQQLTLNDSTCSMIQSANTRVSAAAPPPPEWAPCPPPSCRNTPGPGREPPPPRHRGKGRLIRINEPRPATPLDIAADAGGSLCRPPACDGAQR